MSLTVLRGASVYQHDSSYEVKEKLTFMWFCVSFTTADTISIDAAISSKSSDLYAASAFTLA